MKKTVYIIGIGGRTGAMFAREMQAKCDIVGVGRANEVEMIARGGLKIKRGGNSSEDLKAAAVAADGFAPAIENKYPDYIWLAVRNPVTEAVKTYYSFFSGKDRFPVLVLSQNGLSAVEDAKAALREVLGPDAERVGIIRVSLINGVDAESDGRVFKISYKLPIKMGFGLWNKGGNDGASKPLAEIFAAAGIKAKEFYGDDVAKMENAKLFTNLIGVPAAVSGMSADQGLRDKKIFQQEVMALREYVKAVRASGGGFAAQFCGYPIGFLARVVLLPLWLIMPWRGIFAGIVAKGRNRPKDLGEIDYYNGEVARMGRKYNVKTPVNDGLVLSAKQIMSQFK